ncbi:MAG TPA: hypothetical protein VKT70_00650 [Stellaceae bacterium]|nr:hypothetical protein [Stellaceae bacterium]
MYNLRCVVLLASLLALAACAGAPPEIPYDHSAATDIHTIGFVTPRLPDGPYVILATSVGQNLGLIGALVDSSLRSNRESQFRDVLVQQNFSAREIFEQAVIAKLKAEGYAVSVIPVERQDAEFLEHYPTDREPKVDAYLDMFSIGYGYVAAGIGSSAPYRPGMRLQARLVGAKDAAVLMQDLVFYNPINPGNNSISIAPDPAYQFADFDTLMADPVKATTGLRLAIEQTAQTTSALLK